MTGSSGTGREGDAPLQGAGVITSDVDVWFVREVLPLESVLMQFLRRNWSNKSEIADMRQEVYVRVYEAAREKIPNPDKPFVLTTARNLMINRVRREQVVSIETMADLDALGMASDAPGPEAVAIGKDTLRRVQFALDRLPERAREVIVLKQIEDLSRAEIAQRMGIGEETVKWHLAKGMRALADMLYGEPGELGRKS
jgi:RNA polymerase sigma-70 factor (ECF subfamily)